MNKIYKTLLVSSILVLISACKTSGPDLDKKNVSSVDKAVTNHVVKNIGHVTSSAAGTSNVTTQAAKNLPTN